MVEHYTAELILKRELIPGTFYFVLRSPGIAASARPGQFVMVQVLQGTDPLLRRPISLCGAGDDTVELLFQVKGRGTALMAGWDHGRTVNLLGPLGTGFTIPADMKTAVLVAGGIGAAPLLYLAKRLLEVPGIDRGFYFGSKTRTEKYFVEELLSSSDIEFFFVSEEGSAADEGFVTSAFARNLAKERITADRAQVFSCGPEQMLKKVAALSAKYAIPCQVSLEARMACGVGACLGCAVATKGGYKRACADGPVFDSREVSWSHD